jgi:hypothetical protein
MDDFASLSLAHMFLFIAEEIFGENTNVHQREDIDIYCTFGRAPCIFQQTLVG